MEHNKAFRNRSIHILDQLTFKEHTNVKWEKKNVFSKNVHVGTGNPCPKKWPSILMSYCTQKLTENVL